MSSPPKPDDDNVAQSHSPEDGNNQNLPGQEEKNPDGPEGMDDSHDIDVKEQDRWLPIANVARIMKGALPENDKNAKEAKECMQECVSEFISFITSEASEKCQQEKRKTVNGEDILYAMTSLGFENYSEALKIYLARYREVSNTFLQNQTKTGGTGAPGAPNSTAAGANAYTEGGDPLMGSLEEHDTSGFAYDHNGTAEAF